MENKTEDPTSSNLPPYRTSDIYLSAFLRCRGLAFLKSETERGGRKITFVFEARENIEELIAQYFNNCPVKVQDYKNALRDFKQIAFEFREGGRP
jgi:hypothetical protein